MAGKNSGLLGNVFFWLFLVGASGGAFAGGFWYTYGATVNVNTKSPLDGAIPNRAVKGAAAIAARPSPSPSPTVVPGPLAVEIPSPTPVPTERPTAAPAATPEPVATPDPFAVATAAPTPAPKTIEIYRVQVGAFDSREAAQRQVEELQTVGINAVVVYDAGAYHAQLGAFSDRARAISVADEVNIRGYSVTIRH